MKRNTLLIPFVAVLALFAVSMASAQLATETTVKFNDVYLDSWVNPMTASPGETVPVKVTFEAAEDASDVRVKVYMNGHRDESSAKTERFDIETGKVYTKLLSLTLPSDSRESSEEYMLYVEVYNEEEDFEAQYPISMQKESYTFEVKSVDYTSEVSAGDVMPVAVVVKNTAYNRMDDTYIVVSIPALGVSARGYAGDLVITSEDSDNEDKEDSVYQVVYLKVPENAAVGVYEMQIEAYNDDASTVVKQLVSIDGSASVDVLAATKSQDLRSGETVTYDLVIVNSADSVKVFNLDSISGDGLTVSVPSIVSVGPESSETVSVEVTASKNAEVGTYTFSILADGKQTTFGANVIGGAVSSSIIALTVILVIVFVVLLAVLVVLLTKKEKPIEEVETSYY